MEVTEWGRRAGRASGMARPARAQGLAAHRRDLVDHPSQGASAHWVEQVVRVTDVVRDALEDGAHHGWVHARTRSNKAPASLGQVEGAPGAPTHPSELPQPGPRFPIEFSTLLMRMRRRSPCEARSPSTRPYDPPVDKPATDGAAASLRVRRRAERLEPGQLLTDEVGGADVEGQALAPGAPEPSVKVLREEEVRGALVLILDLRDRGQPKRKSSQRRRLQLACRRRRRRCPGVRIR